MHQSHLRSATLALALASTITGLGACGAGSGRSFEIGLRRIAVDLAYTDEAKLPPPIVVTKEEIIAAPPPISVPGFVTQIAPEIVRASPPATVRPTPPAPTPACPKAAADARPRLPVRVFVTDPPKMGVFPTRVDGTVALASTIGTLKFPLPTVGAFQIRNVQQTSVQDTTNGPTTIISYDVIEPTLDGGSMVTTYQSTNSPSSSQGQVQRTATVGPQPLGELDLVSQVIKSPGKPDSRFDPKPAVIIMSFKSGEGTSWNSAGIDQATGTSMVVQGSIEKREVLDVCGTLYDTYKVTSSERVTNLQSGYSSMTAQGNPNIYNVATQLGGLFISRTVHTAAQAPSSSGAGTTTITLDYTSIVTTADPAP